MVLPVLAAACGGQAETPGQSTHTPLSIVVGETFVTPFDSTDNIDGAAVYHGPDDTHWLIATAKTGNALVVYNAATGQLIRRVGKLGKGGGDLSRPNGIAVLGDSLVFVVERDNARVQVFRLPELTSLGSFGDPLLKLPYGLAYYRDGNEYVVYITDNYETPEGTTPPDRELGARVKVFRVSVSGNRLRASHVKNFGDTTGAGVLRIVESIVADSARAVLVIAEETETDSHLKVYDLTGRFTGQVFGRGLFPQQSEGIALYACNDGAGYWITTDQGDSVNTYHVFDRVSFAHVGSFSGAATRRTDGVALTQRAFGPFTAGAFYGSHLDAAVGAMSWSDIADGLKLRKDCAS
jgi:3-phytase